MKKIMLLIAHVALMCVGYSAMTIAIMAMLSVNYNPSAWTLLSIMISLLAFGKLAIRSRRRVKLLFAQMTKTRTIQAAGTTKPVIG